MLLNDDMDIIRNFTRVYNKFTWVYKNRYLFSKAELGISLTGAETAVLLELARLGETTAKKLREILGMEQGYLSKILKKFQREKLISRTHSEKDARYIIIGLTEYGETFVEQLNNLANTWYMERLSYLRADEIKIISKNMTEIIYLLEKRNYP